MFSPTDACHTGGGETGGHSYPPTGSAILCHSNRYRHTGREYDQEQKTYHHRARNRNPRTGRFDRRDPREYRTGENLYAYVKSNPVNYIDPYGLAASQEQRYRALAIREKARTLFDVEDITDCEALARLVDWMLTEPWLHKTYIGWLNNDEETFLEDLTLALTDFGEMMTSPRTDDLDLYLGGGYARDTGFKSQFREPADYSSNQVRHLVGYLQGGFQYGLIVGITTGTTREWGEPTMADMLLAWQGVTAGAGLDFIGKNLEDLANWIRADICDPNETDIRLPLPSTPPSQQPAQITQND